jgi:hypothetical protein
MPLSWKKSPSLILWIAITLIVHGLQAQDIGQDIAQARSRVTGPVNVAVPARIPGTTHRSIRQAQDTGRLAADSPMERMELVVSSGPAQQAALEQLLRDQQDPSSPRYRQWLTPQQFGEQFGPSPAELDAVTGWLRDSGFTVNRVANGRRSIEFTGTAGLVEQAFHTEMHQYLVDGEIHIANSTDISVPSALAPVVMGVVSIHDFRARPQHHIVRTGMGTDNRNLLAEQTANGPVTQYTDSTGAHSLTPYDFGIIYDVTPVWNTLKVDGTGQKIAVIARSNISMPDVTAFRSTYGLPPASVQVLLNGADPGIQSKTGDDIETTLDTEWSGATAPGASVIVVVSASTKTSDGVDLSSLYTVDNNVAPIVTYSYGTCEADNGTFNLYYYNLWQQAAAQGISVFVSAGDSGSAGCDDPSSLAPAAGGFGVSGLASTPYNVAVGGTEFLEVGGSGQYWAPTNTTGKVSSVLNYIPEIAWNESAYISARNINNGLWAGSGGVSTLYPTPPWQVAPGVPASDPGTTALHHRYLPDVSFTAAAHDGYRVQAEGFPYLISGTSASTPSFAGIMALINQYTNVSNGNPNPRLYALARTNPTIFHDVIVGNNAVPCLEGATATNQGCTGQPLAPGIGTMGGYSAGPGYDLATGLGSVDVYQLLTNWSTNGSGSTGSGGTTGGGGSTGGSGQPGVPPPAGVISLSAAHLATGGGWQTQIELINPTAALATAHLRIYDNNGNTLAIPLASADGTINTTASSLDPQLGPKSVLILQSSASATGPLLQGSAEVTGDAAISGFLIFRYTPTGQEVLVPLSSGAATSYELAFDNTGGLSTGLALASSSTQAVTVGVTALDQDGRALLNSTIAIPALGHQSFVAAAQFAALSNQRGTLQFTPPSGAQISVVGIRATAAGTFTGIPLLGTGGTGSGALADLASGGGWSTLIQLVNTSGNSAQAHLKFYGDSGAPLNLPLTSTDINLNQTASSVDASLLPNGTVLIQSTGATGSALLSGSALSTSDPGVTGFLIFRYNPTGAQVLVPMATGAPNSYLVAFDQTNGLTTGIALSNSTTATSNVTAYLRDQNGTMFASSVITLPPLGHTSFVLTSMFPAAVLKYGTVQFIPPSGQQIGVAGIRYTPAGAFTSIPLLAP